MIFKTKEMHVITTNQENKNEKNEISSKFPSKKYKLQKKYSQYSILLIKHVSNRKTKT